MKILFLGDYSGVHATLAPEFSRRGHSVTVVSNRGLHMETGCDIPLVRGKGRWGAVKYLCNVMSVLPRLRGYDIVQLINPQFLQLRPGKQAFIFREIKRRNGPVFLSLCGNDHYFVKACLQPGFFRYSQFRIGEEPTRFSVENPRHVAEWVHPRMERYASLIYENIAGAMSTLYEYHAAAAPLLGDKLSYMGLPIDTSAIRETPMEMADGKVGIFVGMVKGREVEKGTDRLLDLALSLEREMPSKCKAVRVSNVTLDRYKELMRREGHIVLDQLYSYSPALNALDAMAMGRVAASGAQPEFYDFIGEREMRPVISVDPLREGLREEIRELVLNTERLVQLGRESRKFVEKHNDVAVVADRLEKGWENCRC